MHHWGLLDRLGRSLDTSRQGGGPTRVRSSAVVWGGDGDRGGKEGEGHGEETARDGGDVGGEHIGICGRREWGSRDGKRGLEVVRRAGWRRY